MGELVSPMQLAKELGERPQKLYGLIRRGKLPCVERGGKKYVDREAALQILSRPAKRGRPRKEEEVEANLEDYGVREGTVLAWSPNDDFPTARRRVAKVVKIQEHLAHLEDYDRRAIPYRLSDLVAKLRRETIAPIQRPYNLVRMAVDLLRERGENEQADELVRWLEKYDPEMVRSEKIS